MLDCVIHAQDLEVVLGEMFKSKSVEISDGSDKPTHTAQTAESTSSSSSSSFRRQLTVEELFKGESVVLLLASTGTTLISLILLIWVLILTFWSRFCHRYLDSVILQQNSISNTANTCSCQPYIVSPPVLQ